MSFHRDAAKRCAHKAHKAKLARYETILAGHLTPAQRDFIKRRVEEEQAALRNLVRGAARETMNPSSDRNPPPPSSGEPRRRTGALR
jgi:hypothetical protein